MGLTSKSRVIAIALVTAVAVMGDAMLFIVLPLYWQDFGLTSIWQIGLLLSINRFIRLPLNPLVGYFYKHFQLRTGVFIALILAVITTFSYGVFQDFWSLLMMRALWGVAWSFVRLGGFLTVIDVTTDQNRGWHVGLYNGLWGLGGLVGMLAGGFLVDQTSIFFVTTSFAVIAALAIPVVWFVVPKGKGEPEEKKVVAKTMKKKWVTPFVVLVLCTGLTQGFIVMGLFASTISPLIETVYFGDWQIGTVVIGVATLAGIMQALRWSWDPFVAPLIGRKLDEMTSVLPILLFPLLGGALLFFNLAFTDQIVSLLLFIVLFQLLSTMFTTTTDTLATRAAVRTDRVKMMTAHTVVVDVGSALGPLISFLLLMYYPVSFIYIMAAVILLLLAVSWVKFRKFEIYEAEEKNYI
ncbi:MFS transporter [Alkalihalobacillus sp. 1P02AB]|uniref:MFS transporter n=1 Tax=Alkalihalobacillus sp. 1P02AB TaxID=3132260 RepID=UPI0039A41AF0